MSSGGLQCDWHSTWIHTQCDRMTQAPRFYRRSKTFKIRPCPEAFSSLIQGGPVICVVSIGRKRKPCKSITCQERHSLSLGRALKP